MFQIQTFWHHPMYPDSSYTTYWMLLWIWRRLPSSIWQFLGFLQYWVVGHILTQNNCTTPLAWCVCCLATLGFRCFYLHSAYVFISQNPRNLTHFFLFHFITILRFVKQIAPITCTCDITSFFLICVNWISSIIH